MFLNEKVKMDFSKFLKSLAVSIEILFSGPQFMKMKLDRDQILHTGPEF